MLARLTAARTPTAADLRRWTDLPEERGLPCEIQNLLILTYADQTKPLVRPLRHELYARASTTCRTNWSFRSRRCPT